MTKFLQCLGAALLWVATASMAADAPAANGTMPSKPRPAWAHKDKRIQLLPQGAATDTGDLKSRLMIIEAFSRFGIAYDEAQLPVLASLFTEDALLEIADGQGEPFEKTRGSIAIAKHFASALAQQGDQRRHLISNVVIERLAPNEASALAYGVVTVAADGLYLGASVIYAADLRRGVDGVWRFSRFFIGIDHYAGKKPSVKD
jgi:hypothetical protein